jgi:hypothetical protein
MCLNIEVGKQKHKKKFKKNDFFFFLGEGKSVGKVAGGNQRWAARGGGWRQLTAGDGWR